MDQNIPGLRPVIYKPFTPLPFIIAEYLAGLSARGWPCLGLVGYQKVSV